MHEILARTVTFVLAGGRGERLAPLTPDRSKPAVPFGDGHIIDFALANCLRSNLSHPLVITQYQAAHLIQHVRRWWLQQSTFAEATVAPVCVPAPQPDYVGNADALLRNLHALISHTEFVLVLSADHIYDMDYRELLRFHVEHDADATLGAIVHPTASSQQFGILDVDARNRILGFEEKPTRPKELPGVPGKVLANMGIYVFRRETLVEALGRDAADLTSVHDIGRNIFPPLVREARVYAFRFKGPLTGTAGYWKDVGTIDSYYDACMEWLQRLPGTHRLAGSNSVIADGVKIHHTAEVRDSVLMPGVQVGEGARVRRAILDENVHVKSARVGYETDEISGFVRTQRSVLVIPANVTVRAKSDDIMWRKPQLANRK